MTKAEIHQFASWLGKRGYRARLEKYGIEHLRHIARENGKLGGRPKKSKSKRKEKRVA